MNTPSRQRHLSDGELLQQARQTRLAVAWQSCDYRQRWAWAQIAPFIPDWDNTRKSSALTAYQAFQSIGRARQALSLDILLDAPPTPSIPASPGGLYLYGAAAGSSSILNITGDPYPVPLQIWACAPMLQGAKEPGVHKYAVLTCVKSLTDSGVDLRAAYEKKHGPLCVGMLLWARICPISVSGFRGQPRPISCVVQDL